MLRRPLALALTALTAAAGGLAVTPATTADASAARVVLTLRSASPAALADATARPPVDADERTERASAIAPTRRSSVEHWLRRNGFTVETASDWTVTAHGPAHLLTGRRLPPALRPAVLSAVRESAAAMRPRAVPVGWSPNELRAAYDVRGDATDGAGTTVATIQFSGWRAEDARIFARAAGIALAPDQITNVPVAGARADVPDGTGGDYEVALDVEAVLGAAPAARQRVYIAPNTTSGAIAVYDAVASYAERSGLTAVSISWGACEQETSASLMQSLEQSLARMVAAGATVFAASGDVGAYGCADDGQADDRLAVDYPAASPSVLAVGGTSLRRENGQWVETGWSDRQRAAGGFAGHGSGGGLSTLFPRPVWQPGEGMRMVPDVAAVADPSTGIGIYGPDENGRRGWLVAGGTSGAAPLLAGQLAATASGLGRPQGFGRIAVPVYAAARAGVGVRDVVRGDNLRHLAGPGYDLVTGVGSPQWATLGPRLAVPAVTAPAATDEGSVPVAVYAPASRTARYGLAETAEAACAQEATAPPSTLVLADGPDRLTSVVLAVREDGTCTTTSAPLVVDRQAPAALASLGRTARPGVLAVSWGANDPAPSAGLQQVSWLLRRTDTGAVVATSVSAGPGSALRAVPRGVTYRLEVEAVDALGARSGIRWSSEVTAG